METEFDTFAKEYEEIHQKTIILSGEDSVYFTTLKIKILVNYLKKHHLTISSILDYGCGTGRAYHYVNALLPNVQYHGVDPSIESIKVAKKSSINITSSKIQSNNLSPRLEPIFSTISPTNPLPTVNCCICAVVAHHIPKVEHQNTFKKIFDSLTPGGYLFLFEHNPHNPLTKKVVRDCPFDKDAVLLTPHYAQDMLTTCGFKKNILRYYFFFPKFLSLLRPMEKIINKIPLGAQYVIIAQKPISP